MSCPVTVFFNITQNSQSMKDYSVTVAENGVTKNKETNGSDCL